MLPQAPLVTCMEMYGMGLWKGSDHLVFEHMVIMLI